MRWLKFATGKFRSLRLRTIVGMAAFRPQLIRRGLIRPNRPFALSLEGVHPARLLRFRHALGRAGKAIAEFVGAFALIFAGAGAIIATQGHDLVAIALAHGLAIGVMASAVGHISGGHFNPAITFGFLVTRKIKPALACVYWAAQFAGAVVAALLLSWLLPQAEVNAVQLGVPALGPGISSSQGIVIEGILTFFLVWVVFACAADPKRCLQADRRPRDRLHDLARHLRRRPVHGRGDEPGPRVRARARRRTRGATGGSGTSARCVGGALAALVYELLYLRSRAPRDRR